MGQPLWADELPVERVPLPRTAEDIHLVAHEALSGRRDHPRRFRQRRRPAGRDSLERRGQVARRHGECAKWFIEDLATRLANRVQLTSDGHRAYLEAVEGAFGADVDYAQLVKLYGSAPGPAGRYSPAECTGIKKTRVEGNPDMKHVSTSYVERSNLTMRMHMRRFTRLTNAFSKKVENHAHAVALFTTYYNFVRIHKTLRVTPAMAAGVSDRLWDVSDIVALVEAREAPPAKRGPYKKREKADI